MSAFSEERFTPLRDMSTRKSSSPEFEMRLLHRLEGHGGAVRYCTVDPGGKILATCSTDGKINLWSIATGENIRTLKDGHSAEVTSCSFCSFGSILASSSRDKKVILWNYQTGKRASRLGRFMTLYIEFLLMRFNEKRWENYGIFFKHNLV